MQVLGKIFGIYLKEPALYDNQQVNLPDQIVKNQQRTSIADKLGYKVLISAETSDELEQGVSSDKLDLKKKVRYNENIDSDEAEPGLDDFQKKTYRWFAGRASNIAWL